MNLTKELLRKKNVYLLVLILVTAVAFCFLFLQKRGVVEGFNAALNIPAVGLYINLPDDTTFSSKKGKFGITGVLKWRAGPSTMPDAMFTSIETAYNWQNLYKQLLANPENYIRLDWRTHIPYTIDFQSWFTRTPKPLCSKEYEIKETKNKGKIAAIKSEASITNARKSCNVQITPQLLGSLPENIQAKWIDYIYNEQLQLTRAKRETIISNSISCLNAKSAADSVFSPEMRNAYRQKKETETEAIKTRLKAAGDETLTAIKNATGKSLKELIDKPDVRNQIKSLNSFKNLRPTPFSVFSSALKLVGGDFIQKVLGGVVGVLTDSAGRECPVGFVEGDGLTDPVLKAASDLFPNPVSDIANLASQTCIRYKDGDLSKPEMTSKFCPHHIAVLDPVRMNAVPPSPAASQCEMDRDITKKLQLISDWVTNTTSSSPNSPIMLIEKFFVVTNPSEYFIECAFKVVQSTKNPNYSRTISDERSDTKARFYFNKNNCNYDIFGYFDKDIDFLDQYGMGKAIDFTPKPNTRFILYSYAREKKMEKPNEYAIQNENNKELLLQIQKEEEQRRKDEAEKESLIQILNPTNKTDILNFLKNQTLEELRARQKLITELKDNKYYEIPFTNQELQDFKDTFALLNPNKDARIESFYKSLSVSNLRERRDSKSARDTYIRYLNPQNDKNLEFELIQLAGNDLFARYRDKQESADIIKFLNPNNNITVKAALEMLPLSELQKKQTEKKERDPLIKYFNPNNNDNLNVTYLDKFTNTQLKERKDLITQLNPKTNEEILTLNALDIESLKNKVKELTGARDGALEYFKPRGNLSESEYFTMQAKLKQLPTNELVERKQLVSEILPSYNPVSYYTFYDFKTIQELRELVQLIREDKAKRDAFAALPRGNDCWKAKEQRTNCPASYPY